MTVPAVHCEAKLHGFRRTADGVVVSFVLHPAEVPQALALDPLGTRYMLALCAISDDEQPVSLAGHSIPSTKGSVATGSSPRKDAPAGGPKTPGERAVIRAAILCGEPRFRIWLAGDNITEAGAASMLREACGVASRGDLAHDAAALDRFMKLETEYLMEIGAMARPR